MTATEMRSHARSVAVTERCGKCDNCKMVERARNKVLAVCNPPFSHADQGVVDVWNDVLESYPCIGDSGQLEKATGVDARAFFSEQLPEEELRRTMRRHMGLKED